MKHIILALILTPVIVAVAVIGWMLTIVVSVVILMVGIFKTPLLIIQHFEDKERDAAKLRGLDV